MDEGKLYCKIILLFRERRYPELCYKDITI